MNKEAQILKEMPVRIPVNGTFELTVRCNLHCKMCLFRHDDSENAEIMAKELTTEQWIDMARQAAEAGTMSLLITGGEPMLRPDFCEIWEGIYKQGFIITLYTNATLVTPKIMETLQKYPPHKIGITIYGASAATYEKVCGNGDAFEKMLVGTKLLLELPSDFEFRTTIIKDNLDDLDLIEELTQSRLGQKHSVRHTRTVFPAVRGGSSDVQSVRLSPEDNIKLLFYRSMRKMRKIIGSEKFDPEKVRLRHIKADKKCIEERRFTLFGCNAGMDSFAISWDGKLLGCQLMELFSIDLVDCGFKKAWKEFPKNVVIPEMNQKCGQCTLSIHCEGCLVSRYTETGRLDGCPEYQCREAHELYKMIEKEKQRDV